MFGFFKKKPSQQSPPPVPMPKETKEKIDALNRHLSEFAEGDVHPIEGALAMLLMDKNRHIFEFMHALATSTVELVLSENDPTSPPLLLLSAHNYPMLAVFTQQKRAAKCQEKHPEQRFFLRLPFTVALKRIKKGVGITINPYGDMMVYEMPPDMVEAIRSVIIGDTGQATESPSFSKPSPFEPSLPKPPSLSKYRPGQVWAFHSSTVAPGATLTILRVEEHEKLGKIVHISVTGLRLPNGGTTIGHMPFAESSLDRSVTRMIQEGDGIVKPNEGYDQWREQRGGVFTISVADGIDSINRVVADRK